MSRPSGSQQRGSAVDASAPGFHATVYADTCDHGRAQTAGPCSWRASGLVLPLFNLVPSPSRSSRLETAMLPNSAGSTARGTACLFNFYVVCLRVIIQREDFVGGYAFSRRQWSGLDTTS